MMPSKGARNVTRPHGFSFFVLGSVLPAAACFSPFTHRPSRVLYHAFLSALIRLASS